jgi:trigger factor
MNVQVEDTGACRKTLRIQIPATEVEQEYTQVLAAYRKQARIPGFRPGRAPEDLIKKRFAKDIEQEVRDRLIPKGYRGALVQEKISPVAVLGVQDVQHEAGQPLAFAVTLDVPPEFTLPAYKQIALSGRKVEVEASQVSDTIDRIRQSRARYVDVTDRPVQQGDLVQIDYEAVCEGTPLEALAPDATGLGKGEDFWVHAGENAFLPEFADGLIGMNNEERGQVLVDFPADFHESAVAGKKATYFVTVKSIRKEELPEIDAEFLASVGIESEDLLRERIEEDLRQAGEAQERSRLRSEIVKHLLEHTTMDLPKSVVEEETRNTIYDMVRETTARGASREQIEEQKDQLFEAAGRTASEKVKARYILSRIAAEENIEATPGEVNQRIARLAQANGMTEQEARAEIDKNNMLEGMEDQVRVEKTLDFLLDEAEIKV